MNFKNYLESIDNDCKDFNQCLYNSEMIYNNLYISVIKEEYECLSEGLRDKFINNIKGFFSKMSKWIRGRYRDLKEFTRKTLTKMMKVFNLISKYAKNHKAEILNNVKNKEVYVEILDWTPSVPTINKIVQDIEKINFSDDFEAVMEESKKIVNDYFKTNEIKRIKVDKKTAEIAIHNATECPKIEKIVKKYIADAQKALEETDKASEEGIKEKKDENKVIASKEKVEEGKKKILKTSKKSSIIITLINRLIIDSHKINLACMKA